jgi:hypothetical protein
MGFGANIRANAIAMTEYNVFSKLPSGGNLETMIGHMSDTIEATTNFKYGFGHGKAHYNMRVKHNNQFVRGSEYKAGDISDTRNVEAFAQIFTTFHSRGKQLQWLFSEIFPRQFKDIEDLLYG